jgi:hypothetical protein
LEKIRDPSTVISNTPPELGMSFGVIPYFASIASAKLTARGS